MGSTVQLTYDSGTLLTSAIDISAGQPNEVFRVGADLLFPQSVFAGSDLELRGTNTPPQLVAVVVGTRVS